MSITEHRFSDLLRSPNEVVSDLDHGDVVLRRRDAPDLRLTLAGRDEDRSAADLDEFLVEFTRAIMAASEVDTFAAVGQLLHEWRATAAVHSDRDLADRLSGDLRLEGSSVTRPA